MSEDLAGRLREHLSRTVASIGGWLFAASRGGRIRYDNWRTRAWNRIAERADIRDVNPHDLRHTVATRLFTVDGWTVPQVQAFRSHADPKVTFKIYTHVSSEELPAPSSGHLFGSWQHRPNRATRSAAQVYIPASSTEKGLPDADIHGCAHTR